MDDYSFWMNELRWLTEEYQGHCREKERLHGEQKGKKMGERIEMKSENQDLAYLMAGLWAVS